jgi:uncharacterized membrane protein YebE (DUF533 family)
MNPDFLVRGVLGSVFGGRTRKRSRRAMRYLTGHHGSFWTHPTTLLTGLGLAWGVYETLANQGSGGSGGSMGPAVPGSAVPGSAVPGSAVPGTGLQAGTPGGVGSTPLPPLPNVDATAASTANDEALRLIRLAVSAANADGVMNEQERAAVLQQAQRAGVGEIVEREIGQPRPLGDIVAGITDPLAAATLYVLAFTVLRADEQLTGAERIYLAQLAHLLRLDRATAERLEKDTGERIDALGDQGQLGG